MFNANIKLNHYWDSGCTMFDPNWKPNSFDMAWIQCIFQTAHNGCPNSELRICIWLILNCEEKDFFSLLTTVCTSWTPVNVGTSKRSILLPSGAPHLAYVQDGNSMCERCLGWFGGCQGPAWNYGKQIHSKCWT